MLILLEVTWYILQWLKLDDKIKVKEELCCLVATNYEASTDAVKKKSFFKKLRNESHIPLHDSEVLCFIVISLDTSSKLIFFCFWAIHSIVVHSCHGRAHLKMGLHLLLQLRWVKMFCMKTKQFPKDVFKSSFFRALFSKNSS